MTHPPVSHRLSPHFTGAVGFAANLHAEQLRKSTAIPYIAHLLGVASIALEHGADEEEAIAAVLHDAIEDQGRDGQTREEIRDRFGERVLAIVEGCTDGDDAARRQMAWRDWKEAYVRHIGRAPPSTRLVSASDKLHNARSILSDYHAIGESLWARFSGGRDGVLWYYRALVGAFRAADEQGSHTRLVDELDRVVSEIERRAGATAAG